MTEPPLFDNAVGGPLLSYLWRFFFRYKLLIPPAQLGVYSSSRPNKNDSETEVSESFIWLREPDLNRRSGLALSICAARCLRKRKCLPSFFGRLTPPPAALPRSPPGYEQLVRSPGWQGQQGHSGRLVASALARCRRSDVQKLYCFLVKKTFRRADNSGSCHFVFFQPIRFRQSCKNVVRRCRGACVTCLYVTPKTDNSPVWWQE